MPNASDSKGLETNEKEVEGYLSQFPPTSKSENEENEKKESKILEDYSTSSSYLYTGKKN